MTIEIYRPGVEGPIFLDDGTMHEVIDGNGDPAVLISLRDHEGFKRVQYTDLSAYVEMNDKDRKEKEEATSVFKLGSILQLADGVIARAT
jgi:hypothetical protein